MRDLRGGFKWAIVIWRNGELEVIADLPHTEVLADMNDAGHVVWSVYLDDRAETTQLFFYDGETMRQITDNGLSNQSARINEASQAVWTRYNFLDNPWKSEIMVYDTETDRTMQLSNGQGQMQIPSLNNLLQVTWANPQAGVELWDDFETVQMLPDGVGAAINDRGCIAVARWDENWEAFWLLAVWCG